MSSAAESLPEELWSLIIAIVPCRDRFQACSMVCSKLHRATAAATTDLVLDYRAAKHSQSAQLYLACHGHHVNCLEMTRFRLRMELPCANLQQLHLERCTVANSSAQNTYPSILRQCTALTKLTMAGCTMLGPQSSLSALAAVPGLQDLRLEHVTAAPSRKAQAEAAEATESEDEEEEKGEELWLPASLLLHVPKLTRLWLSSYRGESLQDCLQHLSTLIDLQVLSVSGFWRGNFTISPSTTPNLSHLTALESLSISSAQLDPVLLSASTQIQSLWLTGKLLNASSDAGSACAMLLSCIARMTRLEQLSLRLDDVQWPQNISAYTALTASSRLELLQLDSDNLPGGVWQAMFAAHLTWPGLTELRGPKWTYVVLDEDAETDSEDLEDQDPNPPASALSSNDIKRLVSCCPGLQQCRCCIQQGADLTPLAQLPSLYLLDVDNVNTSSMKSLASLTQLKGIFLKLCESVEVKSVLNFTALRQLRFWHMDTTAVPQGDIQEWGDLWLESRDRANPDVWLQLLQRCASNAACQPLVIRSLTEQLARQQQQLAQQQELTTQQQRSIAELRQQLAGQHAAQPVCVTVQQDGPPLPPPPPQQQQHPKVEQQQRILQQQVQHLQQQAEQQQKQLAATAAECEQLRGRVQGLEAQVQQLLQAMHHSG